ncbi:MAG: hypothetical protein Q8M02_01830 [Candidatus Didemnitutus sp.]|nr:hypothetical protein [Candidatus Didemnitutus sp.]
MNKSTRMIIAAAAIAGLYAGGLAVKASASIQSPGSAVMMGDEKAKDSCKGKDGCKAKDDKAKDSCKGKDGCKAADDKAKDACKSKDGCKAKDDKKAEPGK